MNLTLKAEGGYAHRTKINVREADMTIAFAINFRTGGERLTRTQAGQRYIPVHLIEFDANLNATLDEVISFAKQRKVKSVNISGNGAHTLAAHGLTQREIDRWVYMVLAPLHKAQRLTCVRSGGQTGADEAGIKAGLQLFLPCVALLPAGYMVRRADGMDVTQTRSQTLARLTGAMEYKW